MLNYDHCLRPVFTERIVQLLQRGRSINLIGAKGTGRERLLEDIRRCNLPNTKMVLINLKGYRENYDGFIQAIWLELNGEGEPPNTLIELIERYEECNEQLFIFLYNFDALLNDLQVDQKYDASFYDTLNYIRNRPNAALVCVTQEPHDQSVVFVNGKPHSNSWLDLDWKVLPSLTFKEIVAEIKRQNIQLTNTEQSLLIRSILTHKKSYSLLNYFGEKVLNYEDTNISMLFR